MLIVVHEILSSFLYVYHSHLQFLIAWSVGGSHQSVVLLRSNGSRQIRSKFFADLSPQNGILLVVATIRGRKAQSGRCGEHQGIGSDLECPGLHWYTERAGARRAS